VASAQVRVKGQWATLPALVPINPVHLALMRNGKVLVVAGSGNVATNFDYEAAVWDPQAHTIVTQPLRWDMFCSGMVALPDGRGFINGGNLKYAPFHGETRNAVYGPGEQPVHGRPERGTRALDIDDSCAHHHRRSFSLS